MSIKLASSTIRDIAENYVLSNAPEEHRYFSVIWNERKSSSDIHKDSRLIESFLSGNSLSFNKNRNLTLITPAIIMTIEATLLELDASVVAPTIDETRNAIMQCAKAFGLKPALAKKMGQGLAQSLSHAISNLLSSNVQCGDIYDNPSCESMNNSFGLLWDSDAECEGVPISRKEYKSIMRRKPYDLLVLINGIKELYIKPSTKALEWPFGDMKTKLFLHILKHKGVAGDALYLMAEVWGLRRQADDIRQSIAGLSYKDVLHERTSFIRKMISEINAEFFRPVLQSELKTFCKKQYVLNPRISYCLIQKISEISS